MYQNVFGLINLLPSVIVLRELELKNLNLLKTNVTSVLGLYGHLFSELQPDVKDFKNCSPFTLSSMDLEV